MLGSAQLSSDRTAETGPAAITPALQALSRPGATAAIALQSAIGNRAFARLARAERQTLARACCAGCASGHQCEEEEEPTVRRVSRAAQHELLQRFSHGHADQTANRRAAAGVSPGADAAAKIPEDTGERATAVGSVDRDRQHPRARSRVLLRYGHYGTCTQDDLEQRLWPGDYLARKMVAKTLEVLHRDQPPPYLRDLFRRYFMSEVPDQAAIIRNFALLQGKFNDNDYVFDCAHDCTSTPTQKTLGKTNVGHWPTYNPSGPLILCMNSLAAQIDPVKQTAYTIIHEMGHRYLSGFTGDTYCEWQCEGMTQQQALVNTDSYAVFAMSLLDAEGLADAKARQKAGQGGAPQP